MMRDKCSEEVIGEMGSGYILTVLLSFPSLDVWNCLINSSTCISDLVTHSFSDDGNPFHLIKYWNSLPHPDLLTSKMASISCSSCPSTRSGGGGKKGGLN